MLLHEVTESIAAISSGGSPYRRHPKDLESGGGNGGGFQEDHGSVCDPFDFVSTKSASVDSLKRWRQAAHVLNSSRRFRYTLDLRKEEEKKQTIAKIGTHALIQAARLSQAHGEKPDGIPISNPLHLGGTHSTFQCEPEVRRNMTDMDLALNTRTDRVGENVNSALNTHTNSVGENANSAHPGGWMFEDNFGKWVAFIGSYGTIYAAFLTLALKFDKGKQEWSLMMSIVALALTIFTSWVIFFTNNDLKSRMKKHSPVYDMILAVVFWFSAIDSYLSLLLIVFIPHKINWAGYAIQSMLFVVIFGFGIRGLKKAMSERPHTRIE